MKTIELSQVSLTEDRNVTTIWWEGKTAYLCKTKEGLSHLAVFPNEGAAKRYFICNPTTIPVSRVL